MDFQVMLKSKQEFYPRFFLKNKLAFETFLNYIRLSKYNNGAAMNDLASVFKALADESRLRILNLLFRSGELCVCDIERITGFTQTKVSRHLSYLRNAGLLDDRREGLWMLYSVAKSRNDEHRQLLECLQTILSTNPVALRDARQLARNIKEGCCTTFSEIKPESIPIELHIK